MQDSRAAATPQKETIMRMQTRLFGAALLAIAALLSNALLADELPVESVENSVDIYDEAAYTEYVENTMTKLDALYLDFCSTCGVDATKARIAREEFLSTVRELMQYMNARYDTLDPKMGASLSPIRSSKWLSTRITNRNVVQQAVEEELELRESVAPDRARSVRCSRNGVRWLIRARRKR
jgi:hypothetical protein